MTLTNVDVCSLSFSSGDDKVQLVLPVQRWATTWSSRWVGLVAAGRGHSLCTARWAAQWQTALHGWPTLECCQGVFHLMGARLRVRPSSRCGGKMPVCCQDSARLGCIAWQPAHTQCLCVNIHLHDFCNNLPDQRAGSCVLGKVHLCLQNCPISFTDHP